MSMINCPNCGAQVPAGAAFCDNCGASLAGVAARPATGGLRCAVCGESVMPGEAFCGNCGTPQPAAAPAPAGPSFVPPLLPPSPPSQPQGWSPQPQGWPSQPPAQPPVPQPSSPPPPPIPASSATCPNCGMPVSPNDVFCDNCGHALTPAPGFPMPEQKPAEPVWPSAEPVWPPVAPAGYEPFPASPGATAFNPRLIVQASGATLNMAGGKSEYVIGREDPVSGSFPDVDLVPYGGEEGGVSRRHAKIAVRGGEYFIEDLNSVNYTYVNRQKLPTQVPHPLHDGDEVRLGRVVLQFKVS